MAKDKNETHANVGAIAGQSFQALPIEQMVYAPVDAAIQANTAAAKSYVDFINSVGIDPETGAVRMVPMQREESLTDEDGEVVSTITKEIKVPLLSIIPHPVMSVDEVNVNFEMTVQSTLTEKSETAAEGSFSAEAGWAFIKVKMSGSVSHKKEQTRTTDTRARYEFDVKASGKQPPEGMQQALEWLMQGAATPVITKSTKPAITPPNTPSAG